MTRKPAEGVNKRVKRTGLKQGRQGRTAAGAEEEAGGGMQVQLRGGPSGSVGLGAPVLFTLLLLPSWAPLTEPRGGTSMIRGLSMIRAQRLPFSTMPMIQACCPSPAPPSGPAPPPRPRRLDFISAQKRAACSRGRQISSPPERDQTERLTHRTQTRAQARTERCKKQ